MLLIPIRVVDKNIRYATNSPFRGEEVWSVRRPYLLNEFRFHVAHNAEAFICCQEVLHSQLLDIIADLNKTGDTWAYVGVGRDDGRQAGEYSPILYRTSVWKLIQSRTTWFSDTPDAPSKDKDAASIRALTYGMFEHIASGRRLAAFNTHLDDQSSEARLRAAKFISTSLSGTETLPTFLAGDFNSEPHEEAYQFLKNSSRALDAFEQLATNQRYGHYDTFTGFGFEEEPPKRIDYVFVTSASSSSADTALRVMNYGVLPNRFDDSVFNSDHRAVVVDLIMMGGKRDHC